jgi:hypothetical protein
MSRRRQKKSQKIDRAPVVQVDADSNKSRHSPYAPFGVLTLLVLTLAICVWLWHVEWLRPWLASFGAGMVALLGPIPGLLSSEMRTKWLILIAVAALIGVGTWYASKNAEDEKGQAQYRDSFFESLLKQMRPEARDEFCKGDAKQLRQLVLDRNYRQAKRETMMLQAYCPTSGHALAFAGYAYQGLQDYGEMLTAFNSYLSYADKHPLEAYDGDQEKCDERPSGYCAERTAWIEHLMANYFFGRAQTSAGSEKIDDLRQVVAHEKYMLRPRKVGFHGDVTAHDSTDLLRQTASELQALGQEPGEALLLLAQIEEERRKATLK